MKNAILLLMAVVGSACAGEIRVAFADPSQPGVLNAVTVNGGITVTGYEGAEVIAESGGAINVNHDTGANTVRLRVSPSQSLRIKVPLRTSLKLESTNGGTIHVEGVSGEQELTNLNGGIQSSNVSGAIVAHSLNGRLDISFDKVVEGKQNSLSTLNGSVVLALPAAARATLHLKTDNGSIDSDFELRLAPGTYGRGKTVSASVNGGGADITVKSFNGSIKVKKK